MSVSVVSEGMVMNSPIDQSVQTLGLVSQNEIEFAKCDCCGLMEECTQAYIQRIREQYQGKWICGLCSEAVKYEMRMMNTEEEEEALIQHMSFCNKFKSSSPPPNPAVHLISAMRNILRRSLDSPRSTPRRRGGGGGLSRSGSYIPAVSPVDYNESLSRTCAGEEELEEKI